MREGGWPFIEGGMPFVGRRLFIRERPFIRRRPFGERGGYSLRGGGDHSPREGVC